MSDAPQGPGWWQATDGKWYAPQGPPQQWAPPPGQGPPPGYGPQAYGPPGYVQQPKRKRRKWPWILGVLLVLIIIAAAAGGGGSKNDTANTTASGATPAAKAATGPVGVGTPVKTGDFMITVVSVNDPFTPANQFERPLPGMRIVRVELTVANTTSDQQVFSILAALNIRDSTGGTYHIGINDAGGPSVDGPVPANGTNHGFVTFEVPTEATGLQLQVQGDIFGDAKLINLS